ncbi:MAG: hypothetical protein QW292_09360 [Candidatus Parvarchaeota archaeon]
MARSIVNVAKDRIGGIIIALVFVISLVYYNYPMVLSYNYTVFDPGFGYRMLFLLISNHIFIYSAPTNIAHFTDVMAKMIFFPLSLTLFFHDSEFTLLVDQIFLIAVGGYSLFRITNLKTGSTFASVVMEISYFLYPASEGFMARGGNFMIFFPGLFLLGYLLCLEGRMIPSLLSFTMASISNSWVPIIVLFFFVVGYNLRYFLKQGYKHLSVASFGVFNGRCIHSKEGTSYDDVYSACGEDIDLSLEIAHKKYRYEIINIRIGDYFGSTLGNTIRRKIRFATRYIYLNDKVDKGFFG